MSSLPRVPKFRTVMATADVLLLDLMEESVTTDKLGQILRYLKATKYLLGEPPTIFVQQPHSFLKAEVMCDQVTHVAPASDVAAHWLRKLVKHAQGPSMWQKTKCRGQRHSIEAMVGLIGLACHHEWCPREVDEMLLEHLRS